MTIQEVNGVCNHQDTFVERCLQSISDVIIPRLCNDADSRRIRVKQVAKSGIIVDFSFRATSGSESHKSRIAEIEFLCRTSEELNVFRIRTWPSAFNEVNAEILQLFCNSQLVFDCCRYAFDLHAIAQCGVECFDHFK